MKKTGEDWESPASSIALVKTTHDELLRLARQMLHSSEVLRGKFRNGMRRPLQAATYLWENATPTEEKVALAISEATLDITTLLANQEDSDTGILGRDGLRVAERLVPSSYFHKSLAKYAELTSKQAVEIWSQLVELVCKGSEILPGVHVTGKDNARVILQLNDRDLEGSE